jgi:outer membrane immunogenic protein
MKRMLFAGAVALAAASPAFAADLIPPPAPPPQAPATYIPTIAPVYNWGGIYLGVNGGYGFGGSEWTDPANPNGVGSSTGTFSTDGFVVGGTLGANFQASQLVFGIEADMDYAALSGSTSSAFCTLFTPTATSASCNTQDSWLGTVRGRIGYAFDRVLVYGTGGLAVGDVQAGLSGGSVTSTTYQSSTEYGWTAGGGVEFAMTDNVTAKVEYLFVDLSNGACTAAASCGYDAFPTAANDAVKFDASLIRAGVNLKFNPF